MGGEEGRIRVPTFSQLRQFELQEISVVELNRKKKAESNICVYDINLKHKANIFKKVKKYSDIC